MTFCKANEFGVDWLDLERPFSGNWTLRAKLDTGTDDPPPLGPLELVFDTRSSDLDATGETMTYVGTIIESYADEGDSYIVAVGGAGGLRKAITGDDYERPPPRVVAGAILAAAGEVAGDLSGLDPLPRVDPFYGRLAGRADRQLDALCSLVGARWFVRPDGAVDAGPATWPTYASDPFTVHRPNASGVISAEPDLPDIEPGSVVDGYRVASVRYYVTDEGLSAKLSLEPAP